MRVGHLGNTAGGALLVGVEDRTATPRAVAEPSTPRSGSPTHQRARRRPARAGDEAAELTIGRLFHALGLVERRGLNGTRPRGHPGYSVSVEVQEDDREPFEERMIRLIANLGQRQAEVVQSGHRHPRGPEGPEVWGLTGRHTPCQRISLFPDTLKRRPLISLNDAARRAGVTFPTAAKSMGAHVDLGIARELTGQRRNRVFAYQGYLAILNEGTEPLRTAALLSATRLNSGRWPML